MGIIYQHNAQSEEKPMGNAANVEMTGKSNVSKPDAARVQWPSAASAGGAAYANSPKNDRPSPAKSDGAEPKAAQ